MPTIFADVFFGVSLFPPPNLSSILFLLHMVLSISYYFFSFLSISVIHFLYSLRLCKCPTITKYFQFFSHPMHRCYCSFHMYRSIHKYVHCYCHNFELYTVNHLIRKHKRFYFVITNSSFMFYFPVCRSEFLNYVIFVASNSFFQGRFSVKTHPQFLFS